MQFSVIIPVYNVEKFLVRCVDSVLNQTWPDFEVILVDDGSPDNCPRICDEYAKKDPRVRVIHKPNGGLVSARNVGIHAAQGDYICYVDGDDWTKPEMLQFVHDRLAESAVPLDMVIFASDDVYTDHIDATLHLLPEGTYDRQRLEREVFPYLFTDRRTGFNVSYVLQGHTWNKACRRELQVEHYVRDERIRMYTDIPLTYECLLNCQNVYVCNERLYMYNHTNEQSILAVGKQNCLTESFGYLMAYLQERLRGYGPEIDRQMNEYPVCLIIRTVIWKLRTDRGDYSGAVRLLREGLKKSGMLRFIKLKGLPLNPKIFVTLLRMRCYRAAVALCAVKAREGEQKAAKG